MDSFEDDQHSTLAPSIEEDENAEDAAAESAQKAADARKNSGPPSLIDTVD